MIPAVSSWWRLFRPQNAAIAGIGVWLGWASLRFSRAEIPLAVWGCLSMLLLTAAGNADNDVCDSESDRINHPERPLPSGLLAAKPVRAAAFFLYALAVVLAGMADVFHGILVLGMALLLVVYNRTLKKLPLVGNLAVSLLCSLAIYFPEFPRMARYTLPACVFAFLATLARELVKDLEDVKGDFAVGLNTLPIAAGANPTRKLAFSLMAVLLAMLPLPSAYLGYGMGYAAISILFAAPLLLLLLRELYRSSPDYGLCQRRLKWLMLAGMAALGAGVLTS